MASLTGAAQTPLVELLEGVPADGRHMYEHHSTHHQNVPYGRLCHEAAAEIRRLYAERSLVDRPSSPNALEDESQALRQSGAAASAMTALPVVSIVSVHEPKITTHYGFSGSGQVRLDDFTFVEVNYDYRYTHNSHRHFVTETIASWLRGELKFVPADAAVPQQHSDDPKESA